MPSDLEKLQAHAAHLLDGFLGLREKYAMLEPMLFNRLVVKDCGAGLRARGFNILKNTLFLTCVQEIVKLTLDSDKCAPSIKNIVNTLERSELRRKLRELYSVCYIDPPVGEVDPQILDALATRSRCEQAKRETEFNAHYKELVRVWEIVSSSKTTTAFKTIRDKVSAHTDVHLVEGQYKLIDISKLDIKWKDLRQTMESLQELVVLIGFIVRSSSFAWDSLDSQLEKAATGFWNVTDEGLVQDKVWCY